MIPLYTLKPNARERVRQAAFGTSAVALIGITAGLWRLSSVRSEAKELSQGIAGRQARLAEDRRLVTSAPASKPSALDRSRAVSSLRSALGDVAAAQKCAVDEYQASTDEAPYLTVYASDNKDPGWFQVPVRVALRGRSTAIAASLAALRTLDVPFELDSIEFTRRSTDNGGMATVVAQIALRVLVYKGEA